MMMITGKRRRGDRVIKRITQEKEKKDQTDEERKRLDTRSRIFAESQGEKKDLLRRERKKGFMADDKVKVATTTRVQRVTHALVGLVLFLVSLPSLPPLPEEQTV